MQTHVATCTDTLDTYSTACVSRVTAGPSRLKYINYSQPSTINPMQMWYKNHNILYL